jgi:hypothetical protein
MLRGRGEPVVDAGQRRDRRRDHSACARCFIKGDGKVVRLFPDYRAEEERFFKKTGIFPIMHLITLRAQRLSSIRGSR